MARKHISRNTKIAALLFEKGHVPYEHAKIMHEDHILSLYDWHHEKPHAEDGGDHFTNITPMLRAEHREHTAKITVPTIAKNKRIQRTEAEHKARMNVAYRETDEAIRSCWPKKVRKIANRVDPWPKSKRVLRRSKW